MSRGITDQQSAKQVLRFARSLTLNHPPSGSWGSFLVKSTYLIPLSNLQEIYIPTVAEGNLAYDSGQQNLVEIRLKTLLNDLLAL